MASDWSNFPNFGDYQRITHRKGTWATFCFSVQDPTFVRGDISPLASIYYINNANGLLKHT